MKAESINNFDSTPFANYYDQYYEGAIPSRRPAPIGSNERLDRVESLSDMISKKDQMLNSILFGIGVGSPIIAIIGATLYFALK
jgi:hypothetical protein